ncbi:MAG: 50S ribosomal protein L19e [Candidatus Bathyarchaeia archaeon]
MVNLRTQRRLAAKILKVGENRVWIDPNRIEDVEAAITREEIKKLIHEGVIKPLQEKGVIRARARVIHEKKKKGLRRGPGSRSGSAGAIISKKEVWMKRIRALRKRLRELKEKKLIDQSTYRDLYTMAKSGRFKSVADMERYIESHNLWRKR